MQTKTVQADRFQFPHSLQSHFTLNETGGEATPTVWVCFIRNERENNNKNLSGLTIPSTKNENQPWHVLQGPLQSFADNGQTHLTEYHVQLCFLGQGPPLLSPPSSTGMMGVTGVQTQPQVMFYSLSCWFVAAATITDTQHTDGNEGT